MATTDKKPMSRYNEEYVLDILADIRMQPNPPQDKQKLMALCGRDLAAGYRAEVDEAARRLFGKRKGR